MTAPSYEIAAGRRFVYRGGPATFLHRARDEGRSYVFGRADRTAFTLAPEELAEARRTGALLDWIAPQAGATAGQEERPRRARVTAAWATPDETAAAERRLAYVQGWSSHPGTPRSVRRLAPIVAAVHARRAEAAARERRTEPGAPSARTVLAWIAAWKDGGSKLDALVPQCRNRGRYDPRLRPEASELMHKVIDDVYLDDARPCVAEVHRAMVARFAEWNRGRRAADHLPVPSRDALHRAVKGLCRATVDHHRLGPEAARERWRVSAAGVETTRVNERWEADHTRVDVMVLHSDRKTVVGRPWITLLIDRHSRMIMSFVVSFAHPDQDTVLEALATAVLPKRTLLARYPELAGLSYEAEGVPEGLAVDNGVELSGTCVTLALARVGADLTKCPIRKPWYKGTIERALGTLSRQVFHRMPGSTFASHYERSREKPPETVAVATLEELKGKIWRWVLTSYQLRHHKGIDAPPLTLWRRSVAERDQRLPPTEEEVRAAFSLSAARVVRKDGIAFKGLQYVSEHQLAFLAKPGRRKEVTVSVDRNDLTVVHFTDPDTGQRFPAFLRRDQLHQVRGRTLDEYELARALLRERPEDFGEAADPSWTATYAALGARSEAALREDRLSKRATGAAALERSMADARRNTAPPARPVEVEDELDAVVAAAAAATGGPSVPARTTPDEGTRDAPPAEGRGTASAAEDASEPHDPAAWARARGLGARTRRPGRGGE